jgi:hypothetical protein
MIVRILNYGQYRLADEDAGALNEVDDRVEAAVGAGDDRQFQACLSELVALVQEQGELVTASEFVTSEVVLPAPGTTLAEARSLLTEEGLVPDQRR